ncbi:MAG: hypothetical protein NC485_09825 [Ruminococcus flavefaciens]|nr:hypothetical protein [Ruminococcus flavefaciens]
MDVTTTNLADFGARERHELIEILQAWESSGLPDDFYDDEVVLMFNRDSGYVFLTNSEYQVCMVADGNWNLGTPLLILAMKDFLMILFRHIWMISMIGMKRI